MAWRQRSIRQYALAGLSALAIAGVSLAAGGARTADAADDSPRYYLALGDSLSQGVQPNASPPCSRPTTGTSTTCTRSSVRSTRACSCRSWGARAKPPQR